MASGAVNLPPGFVLEDQATAQPQGVKLPPGFVLEQPAPAQAAAPEKEGFLGSLGSDLWGMAKSIPQMNPVSMLVNDVRNAYQGVQQFRETGKTPDQIANEQRAAAGYGTVYRRVTAPLAEGLGVNVPGMEQAAQRGDVGGVLGHAAAVPAAAAIAKGAGKMRAPLRGSMAGRMAEVPAGEQFSRGEVLQAAREKGVNLDLAQATDSPVANTAKKTNQFSIAAQGTYERNMRQNVEALDKWAESEQGRYSPSGAPRELAGGQVQQALRADLDAKKTAAANAFEDLDKRIGSNTVDATNTVEAEARKIVGEMKDYYAKHPELKPKQAWSIVENLAERPKVTTANPQATAPGLMNAAGEPVYAADTFTKQPAKARYMSWKELHQLRSDLMDVYRNNPDIIKGQSEAWLQRMVQTVDEAMRDASGGLKGADLEKFRKANATWEGVKGTYDNPQSPFYQAIRTQFPSQIPEMLSRTTPELARQVRATLGANEGAFQRSYVERLLTNKSGDLDLKNLNSRLSRIPNDHMEAMLGKDGARQMRLLGKVSQKVYADSNPSGTAKSVVPASEVGGLIASYGATSPELVGQFAGAKLMNSPRVVDYLTRPKLRPAISGSAGKFRAAAVLGTRRRERQK